MEPRKEALQKTPEERQEARKNRFQIVTLEERIAPSYFYNVHAGKYVGGYGHGHCRRGCYR